MISYLLCQFAEAFEAESTKPSMTSTVGKGRKKSAKKTVSGMEWESEREHFIQSICQVLQLEVSRLWEPPVVEEDYTNLVANCCYKLLENPEVSRHKATREAIFRLLGVLVKRYNHSLSASLKIIQLLQHFEHLVSPMAVAIEMFVKDFGVKSVVSEIMREIGRMDPKDLARDNSGTKAYAAFLVELSERIPAAMLPNISVLLCHLDEESYTMRNGVLGVIGEIVVKVLSKEVMDNKEKNDRDQFLDILEDHIHDVNAFVRSKVMQIWLRLCHEKVVPLNRYKDVVALTIGRLEDKSSIVRKQAIQLIRAFLAGNPFAATLPVEDLKTKLEEEKKKLEEMMPDQPMEILNGMVSNANIWSTMEREVTMAIKEVTKSDSESKKRDISSDVDVDSVLDEILQLIDQSEYQKSVLLLQVAMEEFPGNEMFRRQPEVTQEEQGDDEKKSQDRSDNSQNLSPDDFELDSEGSHLLTTLKAIFLGKYNTYIEEGPVPVPAELIPNPETIAQDLAAGDQATNGDTEGAVVNDLSKQQVLVMYLKDCVTFATQLKIAIPLICKLLSSKTASDVMEAIAFFVTAFEFGLSNAMEGVRRMLILIWSKEQGVKEAVVAAYKRLYLNPAGNNQRTKAVAIVKNLTALTVGATIGELKSLEELVGELVHSQDINSHVIQVLWERFAMKISGTTEEDSRAALVLIGMAAGGDIDIIRSNIDVLVIVSTGLGERAVNDFMLVRDTCNALLKLTKKKKLKGAVAEEPLRFPQDHDMFVKLTNVMVTGIERYSDKFWIPMAEQATNVIYRMAEHPDVICTDLLKQLVNAVMNTNNTDNNDSQDGELKCHPMMLTRFLALVGHVAFQQLYHLDVGVLGELKRRRTIQENKKEAEQNKKSNRKSDGGKTKEPSLEEELGLTGAVADDAEAEYMKKVLDTDIVTGTNLLALFTPLITTICLNSNKYTNPELRAAANMTLAKFMLVSSEYCETHLQLLFTLLEKAQETNIRANTIIALGDLTVRFPNLIEPWTPNLYARLRDESTLVRKNTLTVLTRLILNDMVKVKGQISEIANCIVDGDDRINNMAKMFFHELAKKGNAVYNIMPDVISRLSDPDVGVEEEHFKTIMRYLFSFIQKDRQCESLVEKLCHRFRAARTDRQVRDLAFCLSLLEYSERSLRKLQENFACFADKLAEDEVYHCFTTVTTKMKKFVKPETKTVVEELEGKLLECHTKGMNEDEIAQKASQASAAAGKGRRVTQTPGKTLKAKTPGRRRGRSVRDDDDDSDDDDDYGKRQNGRHPATRGVGNRESRKATRGTKDRRPKPPSFSSDDDSDLELFDVQEEEGETNGVDGKDSAAENEDPNEDSPTPAKLKRSGKKKLLARGKRGKDAITT
ncbi:condensin complex subunit 1-like [Glandiceps talaboti]